MSRDRNPVSRRKFMIAGGLFAASAFAAPATASASKLLSEPPDHNLVTSRVMYFPATGHHVSHEYLTMWGRMGGLLSLGPPISEPVLMQHAEYQVFRNGVLYRPVDDAVIGSGIGDVDSL